MVLNGDIHILQTFYIYQWISLDIFLQNSLVLQVEETTRLIKIPIESTKMSTLIYGL